MRLIHDGDRAVSITGLGIVSPGDAIEIDDERGKSLLDQGGWIRPTTRRKAKTEEA